MDKSPDPNQSKQKYWLILYNRGFSTRPLVQEDRRSRAGRSQVLASYGYVVYTNYVSPIAG